MGSPYEQPYSIKKGYRSSDGYVKHITYKEKMYSNESYDLTKNVYRIDMKQILRAFEVKSVKNFSLEEKVGKEINAVKVSNHDISQFGKAL